MLLLTLLCGGAFLPGLGAVPAAAPAEDGQFTLDHLSALLSTRSSRNANFEELHFSNLLSEPIRIQGTLFFVAPGKLEKRITAPYQENYIAEGNVVVYENKAKRIRRTVALEDYPLLAAVVETLRATFAGDFITLAKFYRLNLKGDRDQWELTLEPHQKPLRGAIAAVTIRGMEKRIARLDIYERNGDHSEMRIIEAR